jgi:transcription initiation factor TFIIB
MCEIDVMWHQMKMFRKMNEPEVEIKKTAANNPDFCSCGGMKQLAYPENTPVCSKCGVVDEHYTINEAEWSSNVDETGKVNDAARCGAPQDLDRFSSQWGGSSIITGGKTYRDRKLAKISFHMSMNHRDRALYHAYKGMDEIAKDKLKLPDGIIRVAQIMYRKFNEEKLTRGAVRTGIKANCILYACKINNISRTIHEVASAFGIPTKDISRTSQMFTENLPATNESPHPIMSRPADVCPRLLQEFSFEGERRKMSAKCIKMCNHLEKCVKLMGKNPTSIAYVVIMKELGITKKNMCETCNISPPTLNKIELLVDKYLENNPYQ